MHPILTLKLRNINQAAANDYRTIKLTNVSAHQLEEYYSVDQKKSIFLGIELIAAHDVAGLNQQGDLSIEYRVSVIT